jgi:microsomal dipeptidase-like Zn-dependent dipeptidase
MALWGFADLHAHPASHLGFGARGFPPDSGPEQPGIFWGKPGLEADRIDLAADLPACNPLHTTVGDNNLIPVRDKTREIVLNTINNMTGIAHQHEGWPNYRDWPQARSIMHQQMHISWIRRAYQGGLRLLFASVTDSETLSMLWHRFHSAPRPSHDPNHDYESARKQLRFIRELASCNDEWMEVVTSPAQARQVIGQNRLAVILSLEMDTLTVEQIIALKNEFGVRQVTPIHLADNTFGGVAVYNDAFNTSNQYLNGGFFQVQSHPSLSFRLSHPQLLYYLTGDPFTGGDILKHGAMELVPLGAAEYAALRYPTDVGHRNVRGVDQARLRMLMQHGLLIDLAHMSEYSQDQALALAEHFRYPVMNSHTGLRPDGGLPQGSERDMRRSFAQRIAALGGVIGLGTSREDQIIDDDPVSTWIGHYLEALETMSNRGVALGTDMNGFAPQIPFSRSQTPTIYPIDLAVRLASPEARSSVVTLDRHRLQTRTFDFTRDGIAHYGMLPDFLQAIHGQLRTSGQDADRLMRQMFHTAEDTIAMWERAEAVSQAVRQWEKPTSTVPLDLYWSGSRSDNFTTATEEGRRDARAAGYSYARTEGYVFRGAATGRSALKLFWSAERGDNFTTASADGQRDAELARYQLARTEGYVSTRQQPGMVPLWQFWKDSPRHDNFLTASSLGKRDAESAGYTFVRKEGYIYPRAIILRAHNGQFVGAVSGGGGGLDAARPSPREHETFDVVYLGPARIALRTYVGFFLSAQDGGGREVLATGLSPREWETFQVIQVDESRIALKTYDGRFFLSAEGGGGGPIVANRTARDIWETFELIAV